MVLVFGRCKTCILMFSIPRWRKRTRALPAISDPSSVSLHEDVGEDEPVDSSISSNDDCGVVESLPDVPPQCDENELSRHEVCSVIFSSQRVSKFCPNECVSEPSICSGFNTDGRKLLSHNSIVCYVKLLAWQSCLWGFCSVQSHPCPSKWILWQEHRYSKCARVLPEGILRLWISLSWRGKWWSPEGPDWRLSYLLFHPSWNASSGMVCISLVHKYVVHLAV